MIRNLSYNDKKIQQEVNTAVGKAYSLLEKLRMKGNGSQRFFIKSASETIESYLQLDNNLNHCNIEIRSGGIIIRFRSLLETIGWIIPYHQLSVYQNSGEISIYSGSEFLKLRASANQKLNRDFLIKLLEYKNQSLQKHSLYQN